MPKVKVTDRDKGMKALLRTMRRKQPTVVVGVLGADKTYDDGTSVQQVAAIHEFGVPGRIPKRSWLRETVDLNRDQILLNLGKAAQAAVEGKASPEQAVAKVGVWLEGVIRKRISARIPPPLSPVTIERKGSSVPLIDTGQFRKSITSEVRK